MKTDTEDQKSKLFDILKNFHLKNVKKNVAVISNGQNHNIYGNMVSTGAGAVCLTDDSCSLHSSHMASTIYVCSAFKS